MSKDICVMHGEDIFTVKRYPQHLAHPGQMFRWLIYKNGSMVRMAKTKAEAMQKIDEEVRLADTKE